MQPNQCLAQVFKKMLSYKEKIPQVNKCINESESDSNGLMEEEEILERKKTKREPNALCPVIQMSKEEWKALYEPWKLCLVKKLLGKTLGFYFLRSRLQKLWQRDGNMEVIKGRSVFL